MAPEGVGDGASARSVAAVVPKSAMVEAARMRQTRGSNDRNRGRELAFPLMALPTPDATWKRRKIDTSTARQLFEFVPCASSRRVHFLR